MNMFIKNLVRIVLFSALVSVSLANEPEQISQPRYNDQGVHYGLPGWEIFDSYGYTADFPEEGSLLYVNLNPQHLENNIKFGGAGYDEVTITSTGRIYLGHVPDDYDFSEGARGYVPFLETTKKRMQPVSGSSSIQVKWLPIKDKKGYAVVEIGPFNVEGFQYPVSFQVYFYTDGEIQFQPWIEWGSVAAYTYNGQYGSSPLNQLINKDVFSPALYNGGYLLETNYRDIISWHAEPLVYNGQLRPGWIAKSFDGNGVLFNQGENCIEVYFGAQKAPGGLLAFDHSREHPVVGSFNYVTFEAQSITYGDGRTAQNPIEVLLWYFGTDNGDIYKDDAAHADYPYFLDGAVLGQNDIYYHYPSLPKEKPIVKEYKFSTSKSASVIWPVAYMKSWHKLGTDRRTLEMTKAIAFKFQTSDTAYNRAIRIKNISYGLRQPRSVQFLKPQTDTLFFESDGLAYMKGINFSGRLPYEFINGSSLYAKIVPAPGDTIDEVVINGFTVYKHDGPVLLEQFATLPGDGTVDLTLEFLTGNVYVTATSKKCGTRVLPAVNPSYVKAEVFLDPSNMSRKLESYSVKDGLGRVVQTQTDLGNGKFNVNATYLDDFGNVEFAPLSYLSSKNSFAYEDMYCKQCIVKSSAYHNGDDDLDKQQAFGVPYAKEDYHYGEDNGVTKDVSGVAEASYAKSQNSAMQWTIPLNTSGYSNFLSEEQLNEKVLTEKYATAKKAIVNEDVDVENWTEYSYKLVVNRSMEGVFTQQIFDANGNILYAWAKSGDHIVISRTNYNSDNQVESTDVSVDNGVSFILATTYSYDAAGRVKTVTTPDKGTVVSMYDDDDHVRFTRDARQQAMSVKLGCSGNYFSTIEYDGKGKVTKTGEVRCGHSFTDSATAVPDDKLYILSENFYGKPTVGELLSTGVTTDMALLQGILDQMEGVLPNDVGAVASYDGSRVRSDATIRANSLKMSSYNRLGQKVRQWTIYGLEGAPATQTSFTYNVSGELSTTETAEWKNGSWSTISTLTYDYDNLGRLKSVLEGGDSLMRVDRTEAGTVSKKAYFDKGDRVYDMTYAKDIYGRTTRVSYKDAAGKTLYSESATYPSVVAGRLAAAQHVWDGYSSDESYSYDKQGRLTGYSSNNGNIGEGLYQYDGLGRLTSKREGRTGNDTTISYTYDNAHFRPLAMNVNNEAVSLAYYVYDASGNVWIDRNSKNTYTINALGLPSRVRLFSEDPVNSTYDDVQGDAYLTGQIGFMDMAYDEGGQRIWTKFVVGAPAHETKVTYPGIGEYTYFGQYHSDNLTLTRVDLLGGGYRTGLNGEALFPVKDLQGSIRGYANKTGLKSAFGYRPYGTTVDLARYVSDNDERWQGKKFDGEHGKYYFGARYYDSFFGMWMSPDPAGQFANPYSYGGDPLNYIDPTGMWAFGLGLVIGYDKSHGWSFGIGAAAEFADTGVNAAFSFNQDGSKSLNLSVNASIPVFTSGLWMNAGGNFSFNTYTGFSLSRSASVCWGASAAACAGVEVGDGFTLDRNGKFGMTVHAEAYATFAGVRTSVGAEAGFFGAEGRGLYAGIGGYGLHAQVSHLEDGFDSDNVSWGMRYSVYYGVTNDLGDDKKNNTVSRFLWIPELGSFGKFKLGASVDETREGIQNFQKDLLLKMADAIDDYDLGKERFVDKLKNNYKTASTKDDHHITAEMLLQVEEKLLLPKGFVRVVRGDKNKVTYAKNKNQWGSIEFKTDDGGKTYYSSYNHGSNNPIDHFFLDVIGYYMSN
ncbi:MAG: hypothetical protein J6Y14_00105 [Fibrobacter sp.]|nr:hypothetical protein [Fibrobacter sp.]